MLIDPVPYGPAHSDLAPFLEGMAERVARRTTREPLALLSASQVSFDARWEELDRSRAQLGDGEYFRQSRVLAEELRRAGGQRRAALAFSGRLALQDQTLPASDYVGYALDAVEWLIDEDLPQVASSRLAEIGQRIGAGDIPAQLLARYHHLRIRCMDALCAYTEALRAIEEALPLATPEERARLEAERSEMHFLQGDFPQAIADE